MSSHGGEEMRLLAKLANCYSPFTLPCLSICPIVSTLTVELSDLDFFLCMSYDHSLLGIENGSRGLRVMVRNSKHGKVVVQFSIFNRGQFF